MNLEITGKLIKKLPEQTGEGKFGKWIKQEFVIETQDQYPKKVCFSTWGDKTDILKKFSEGDIITVSFNPESREYNERWYTDLRAWKITGTENQDNKEDMPPPFTEDDIPPEEDDLPF
ncbi:MAG: DUF3127 domain-containing protein [Chlorobi bacterium]|nr:DUF3127 domain-containing protein [Chlorobiota bacterium]